jgi:predicted nucleic acid-binding protein
MTTFVDTNVLIAFLKPDEPFHAWSVEKLRACKENGPAIISDIVYCELSVGMKSLAEVDATISQLALERVRGTDAALFRAGKAFKQHRDARGLNTTVLPDFIIGAIAAVAGAPLLTANPKDFVRHFPELRLITP